MTTVGGMKRGLFIKQQAHLKALLHKFDQTVDDDASYLAERGAYVHNDYCGNWMAVANVIQNIYGDENGESSEVPTNENVEEDDDGTKAREDIMKRHQSTRYEVMFGETEPVTSGTTKLLRANENRLVRSKSWCGDGKENLTGVSSYEKDARPTPDGVNWVCLNNPKCGGLNAPCMRPASNSPLIHIKPRHGFNLQASDVSPCTKIIRNVRLDDDGIEHDEKRIYFRKNRSTTKRAGIVSPWHDITVVCMVPPTHIKKDAGLLCNMVVEIPRFTSAKMEIATNRTHNPIVQDVDKKLKERFYPGPIMWNYGAFPQTWEDPTHGGDEEVHFAYGDGDPLDVVDVGRKPRREFVSGDVVPVRVLGALPMLDGGGLELDWKVIAINVYDEHFSEVHDLHSLEKIYPHTLNGVREWFRWYKYSTGSNTLNEFGYMGLVLCRCDAEDVLYGAYEQWDRIQEKCIEKIEKFKEETQHKERKLHLVKEFEDDIWHPVHLRPTTKAYKDRYEA